MSKSVKHLAIIGENDEYGTPSFLFLEACKKYNCNPVVDYFASKTNHVGEKYYTKDDLVFEMEWFENGFINPPYSRKLLPKIMKKAWEQHQKHNIELLILTYAKTDTQWWHNFVEGKAEVHFHNGRITFLCKHGFPKNNKAPYPSAWIIYRPKQEIKARVQSMFPNFQKYGNGR